MERCVVVPAERKDLLELVAALALAALKRVDGRKGKVVAFLPGMQEMLTVQTRLKQALQSIRVILLHSDVIGNEDEEEILVQDNDEQRVVYLSTVIGARAITLDMRYAISHQASRAEALHSSGLSQLIDELLSKELEGTMCGRVARLCPGLAALLYGTDDTVLALAAMPKDVRLTASENISMPVTLVLGSPSRFLFCRVHFSSLAPAGISADVLDSNSRG